jgi:type VII secretion-associated serine protease mycosin
VVPVRWQPAAAAAAATLAVLVVPAPARAANVCDSPPAKATLAKGTPVEDQMYAPKRLAPLATGAGVRVAVIDSGVDAGHPQLRGRVAQGNDFLHGDNSGRQDCVGHGTAVASIIAAGPLTGTGFQGLAPGATIVPVRISEQTEIDGKAVGDRGTPRQFARAITWAVDNGDADVINLSLVMTDKNDEVQAAIQHALDENVVVVAAAGNHGDEQGGNPTPYPAAYPGVIGVGAITADGVRAPYSQHGDYVDIAAVGDQVTVAARGEGNRTDQGTSFAAPFVSATAALIRQRFPGATPADVLRRLTATADPAPGGTHSPDYGYGLLNPYRALTESLGPATRAPAAPVVMHGDDSAAIALARRREHAQAMALVLAAAGAGLVLLLAASAVIVRRGRRRGWQPADR